VWVAMSDALWAVSRDERTAEQLVGQSERHWAVLLAGPSVLLSAAQTVGSWAGRMAGCLAGLWVVRWVVRMAVQMVHHLAAERAALMAGDSAVYSVAVMAERWEQRREPLLADR
jgi:hypothetical protein